MKEKKCCSRCKKRYTDIAPNNGKETIANTYSSENGFRYGMGKVRSFMNYENLCEDCLKILLDEWQWISYQWISYSNGNTAEELKHNAKNVGYYNAKCGCWSYEFTDLNGLFSCNLSYCRDCRYLRKKEDENESKKMRQVQ